MIRVLWLWANMYSDASNKYKVDTAKEADYMIMRTVPRATITNGKLSNRPTTLRFARRLSTDPEQPIPRRAGSARLEPPWEAVACLAKSVARACAV